MPRCLMLGRCGGPLITRSTGSTWNSKMNYTNKVKWNNSLTLYIKSTEIGRVAVSEILKAYDFCTTH